MTSIPQVGKSFRMDIKVGSPRNPLKPRKSDILVEYPAIPYWDFKILFHMYLLLRFILYSVKLGTLPLGSLVLFFSAIKSHPAGRHIFFLFLGGKKEGPAGSSIFLIGNFTTWRGDEKQDIFKPRLIQ